MAKPDAIILAECTEIMDSLPVSMRHDDEILDAVLFSLSQDIEVFKVKIDALEVARIKSDAVMIAGFQHCADEFKNIRHELEVDRVHLDYAKKSIEDTEAIANKNRNLIGIGYDPLAGITFAAFIFLCFIFLHTRIEVRETAPRQQNQVTRYE